MTKTYEFSGKTIDDAIQSGLSELGLSRDDVSIEVMRTPQKGFLGIGSVDALVKMSVEEAESSKAHDFLSEVFAAMGAAISPEISEKEGHIEIALSGDDLGIVIGRRGETLDALQYLTSIVVNRGSDEYTKVTIDAQNYRKKREETLNQLAKRLSERVLATKRNMTLEPMSAYERRIIHFALQDVAGITTFSTGQDPNRKVVIAIEGRGRGPRKDRQK